MFKNTNSFPPGFYNCTFSFNSTDWNGSLNGMNSNTEANTNITDSTAEKDTSSSNYTQAVSMARDYHAIGLSRNDAETLIKAHLPVHHRVDIPAVVQETYTKEIVFPKLYQGNMADYVLSKLNNRLYKIRKKDDYWYWDGERWDTTFDNEMVEEMILDIMRTQPGVYDKALGSTYQKWVNTTYNIRNTTAVVKIKCPKIEVSQINTNPLLFNMQNGVFSFEAMKFRKAEQNDFLISTAPFNYDARATCPQWDEFIRTITLDKQDLYDYYQMMTGYALLGHNKLRRIFFFIGNGYNGKGTYIKLLEAMMGEDYSSPLKESTAKAKKWESKNDDLMPLINKRAYFLSEMKADDIVDAPWFKAASSGDSQMGRGNYENFRKFNLFGKPFIATNELPKVKDNSDAYYDRLNIVPFDFRIAENKKDINLLDKLKAEIPGIFNWAVEGISKSGEDWINFRETADMISLKEEYRKSNDSVYEFMCNCYNISDVHKTPTREVYADYNTYMKMICPSTHTEANGYTLKDKFTAKGVRYVNSNGTWFYLIRKPEWVQQLEQLKSNI